MTSSSDDAVGPDAILRQLGQEADSTSIDVTLSDVSAWTVAGVEERDPTNPSIP